MFTDLEYVLVIKVLSCGSGGRVCIYGRYVVIMQKLWNTPGSI
jgi:hypothetical protein